jgi:Tfp pilus assembly protein PilF
MTKQNRMMELLSLTSSLMGRKRWRKAVGLLNENSPLVERQWQLLWNLGWCHFKLNQMDKAERYMSRATRLAPKNNFGCKLGLGVIYVKIKQYRKAETILSAALRVKESYVARLALAFAYLAQGKLELAEKTHLDGIRLKPKRTERYEAYSDFLSDIGREAEAEKVSQKAKHYST